ncbi:MAG: hypothetical protein FWC43_04705 [Planctomycetaceae bacterium]|nr:hypothetical protein [Planctomycetaceae bacterium]
MRFRAFAAAFFAVLCGSALYAQLPERVTFQPATFGHATHYGFYDAGVGNSGKMTYANTNPAYRNSNRGAVVRPYGTESAKIVGYSQPEYRMKASRRYYTPANKNDCPCIDGETTQVPPQVKPNVEIKKPVEKPIVPPVAKPVPTIETMPAPPQAVEKAPVTPAIPIFESPALVEEEDDNWLDKLVDQTLPDLEEESAEDDEDDPFGDNLSVDTNDTELVDIIADDDEDDPFGDNLSVDTNDTELVDIIADDDEDDPFGDNLSVDTNDTELVDIIADDDEDDPFGDNLSVDTNDTELVDDATDNEDEADPFGDDPSVDTDETEPADDTIDDEDDPFKV